jgi:transcriptional regulator with XRE-family HTH domain
MEIWLSGMRQNRLARALSLDETVLSKVINGYRQPSPELRMLLAQYFNKSEAWLFQKEPGPTGKTRIAEPE